MNDFDFFKGILKHKSRADIILKLVQEGARGQRELELYERVEAIGKSENGDGTALKVLLLLRDLYTFLPRFYGCTDIRLNEKGVLWIWNALFFHISV